MLHTSCARGCAEADLRLADHGVLPCGETHVARQREFTARAAALPRSFAIVTTGSSLSLRQNMPNDASSGPPAFAASAMYSATLVRSTCGTKNPGPRSLAP